MFVDRRDGGRRLAAALARSGLDRPVVLGLPRGGVPVAAEVARVLDAPVDVLVVRKLGYPLQPELGIGAVGEGGVRVLNARLVADLRISDEEIDAITAREARGVERRVHLFRGDRPPLRVDDRIAVLVDDGLATGFTARAAIEMLRRRGTRSVVVAVPVAPRATVDEIRAVADEVVVLEMPDVFFSIGQFYEDFAQTPDEEVIELLARDAGAEASADPYRSSVRDERTQVR